MKKQILLIFTALFLVFITQSAFSQVLVSDIPAATADASAMLDVQSTSKGFLFPRMTRFQRNAITNPPTSMIIFQTDNTPGLYYNIGTAGVPDWQVITDATNIGGYWTENSGDLYYTSGNVGIGTSSPAAELHVDGATHLINDSVLISGRPGRIFLGTTTTGYEPGIRFSYNGGSALFRQFVWSPGTNPYLTLAAAPFDDQWAINPAGTVWHLYKGTATAAYIMRSSAAHPTLSITNDNGDVSNFSYGIQVMLTNNSLTTQVGIGSFVVGTASGLYGQNTNLGSYGHVGSQYQGIYGQHGTTSNKGGIGSSTSGVWGEADATGHVGRLGLDGTGTDYGVYGRDGAASNPNWGGIGSANYGVYGQYESEPFFGGLGASNCGVLGSLGGGGQNLNNGDYAVIGEGVWNPSQSGIGYSSTTSIGGVKGYNGNGVPYSFGVAGFTTTANVRTGGVLGHINNNNWGSLGYRTSGGTNWGVYANGGTGAGTGKSQSAPMIDIGMGAYGDLFGAHIDGNVYGLYARGVNYGIYTDGDVYRTGADVHLQQDMSGQNNVMYTLVSPEMTIQTYGIGQMQNGKSNINFDEAFANVVSSSESIIVTITPIGKSEGVYLDQVDANGFSIAENNNGKSSIQFSWIAIGKRSGYENMSLPSDVIATDYNEKIQRGLSRDADPNAQGEGLYYQNGTLHNGHVLQPKTSNGNAVESAVKPEISVPDNIEDLRMQPIQSAEPQTKETVDIIKK